MSSDTINFGIAKYYKCAIPGYTFKIAISKPRQASFANAYITCSCKKINCIDAKLLVKYPY